MYSVKPSVLVFSNLVNNSEYPLLFKNSLRNEKGEDLWKLLSWSFEELAEKFGDLKLPFRTGSNAKTPNPQWEYLCKIEHLTMKEFIEKCKLENDSKWHYFDYKYMREWFSEQHEIMESIDWRIFGFDKYSEDSVLWLGNKGAHTTCHQDSYGCNLVAQIHGSKQWVLYPPNVNLRQTRIPYEESTIYSEINFFSPSSNDVESLTNSGIRPRVVTLNRGDVLFVPHGWWHYVESLDLSFSVNMWLPMENDCYRRLGESLIKFFINQVHQDLPTATDEPKYNLEECLNFVKQSLDECKTKSTTKYFSDKKNRDNNPDFILENVVTEYKNHVSLVEELPFSESETFFSRKSDRFPENQTLPFESKTEDGTKDGDLLKSVVNAFCDSEVIEKVMESMKL